MKSEAEKTEELKLKVKSASELVEWLSEKISQMEHEAEELKKPLEENLGYRSLVDSMTNGWMASYRDEFSNQ